MDCLVKRFSMMNCIAFWRFTWSSTRLISLVVAKRLPSVLSLADTARSLRIAVVVLMLGIFYPHTIGNV